MAEMKKNLLPFYKIYTGNSDLHFVSDKKWNDTILNSTDIDFNFIRHAYPQLYSKTNEQLKDYVKDIELSEIFFHPKQLINIFGDDIIIKEFKGKIYVEYKLKDNKLNDFIRFIEKLPYNDFKNTLLELKINKNFHSSQLLIALFIGNIEIGLKIIVNVIKYKAIQDFQLAICVKKNIYNNEKDINEITHLLNTSDINYILYASNELGNDITPTLLMYDDIRSNYYFDYVTKLHTKTNKTELDPLVYAAMSTNLESKIFSHEHNKFSSCHGNLKFYRDSKEDNLNRKLYSKFSDLIKKEKFVSGTIFFTNFRVMDNMVVFMKANYLNIFLQNTYDDNQINQNSSYPHFMERLFGLMDDKYPLNAEIKSHK